MSPAPSLTPGEFEALFDACSNWGRWGAEDQRGTLNFITPAHVAAARELIRDGVTVSCSQPLATTPGPGNPNPVVHLMVNAGDIEGATGSADYLALRPHGTTVTHLDAMCHIFHRGSIYNGVPQQKVTSMGALAGDIGIAREGIAGRGVLLDIAAGQADGWLEPGAAILPADLEACEARQSVQVGEGDILLVRTGILARRKAGQPAAAPLPGGIPMPPIAGLHASCGPWLHERKVALLGGDNYSDVYPSGCASPLFPVHVLTLVAMGMHLLDNAELDPLAQACAERGRWDFFFIIAPLVLERGTASPVNPIAIL